MSKQEQNIIETRSVDEVLSIQLREILNQAGISGLYVEEDGSLSGSYVNKLWPSITEIKNIKVVINERNNRIELKCETGETRENTGAII